MRKASAFYYTFCFIFEYWQEKENGLFGCRKNRFPKLHLQAAKNELKRKQAFLFGIHKAGFHSSQVL